MHRVGQPSIIDGDFDHPMPHCTFGVLAADLAYPQCIPDASGLAQKRTGIRPERNAFFRENKHFCVPTALLMPGFHPAVRHWDLRHFQSRDSAGRAGVKNDQASTAAGDWLSREEARE